MLRNVAVFTGTRADYGLLYWLLHDIEADSELHLQLFVSGSHLSPEFGSTYRYIENDGFRIDEKVEILLSSDSSVGVVKSMGLGMIGFADVLNKHKPDICIVLGDRFETLAFAQAAMLMNIPIAHLHGGEITEGAYDDSIRHALSKLSYLHFTATEIYRKRVIQLGESPERVFNIGALGIEHLYRTELMSLEDIEQSLNFKLDSPFVILTYHPVTLLDEDPVSSFNSILAALEHFQTVKVIITYPNADEGGRKIIPLIESYAKNNPNRVKSIQSLGQRRYLSTLRFAKIILGNSSSGIIEAPSFNVPTINIGVRQQGRLAAKSVIDCLPDTQQIISTIEQILDPSKDFDFFNPYDGGSCSKKILDTIKSCVIDVKKFYDLPECI